jgi:uncharacterized protein
LIFIVNQFTRMISSIILNVRKNTLILVLLFWMVFIGLLLCSGIVASFFHSNYNRYVNGILGSITAFFTIYLFLRFQKISFASIGLRLEKRTLFRFIRGFAFGSIVLAIMLVILYGVAGIRWEKNAIHINTDTIIGYLAIIPLALMEELGFRSYSFVKLHERYGLWIAQIIVAVAFALYHLPGGQSISGVLLGPGIWALVFGLAVAYTGGIAMPLGIHVALNAGQVLMGLKGNDLAGWKMILPETTTLSNAPGINTVGIYMQLGVLIIAITLTEILRKKNSRIQTRSTHTLQQIL